MQAQAISRKEPGDKVSKKECVEYLDVVILVQKTVLYKKTLNALHTWQKVSTKSGSRSVAFIAKLAIASFLMLSQVLLPATSLRSNKQMERTKK
jgi:hypothetical protein